MPGFVQHKSSVALLLIDVINAFEFPDGAELLRNATKIGPAIASLKKRVRRAGVPVIYVNDNFGQWRSNSAELVDYGLRPEAAGRDFVSLVRPDQEDYVVLKPMHSAFYQTPLETLLRHVGATSLIVAGLATNSCIVCTVHDGNMRDYKLFVPADCSAARTQREHRQAIEHVEAIGHADVTASASLNLRKMLDAAHVSQRKRS